MALTLTGYRTNNPNFNMYRINNELPNSMKFMDNMEGKKKIKRKGPQQRVNSAEWVQLNQQIHEPWSLIHDK